MHRLVVLLVAGACVTSIFAGLSKQERDCERMRMCTTRNASENVDSCTSAFYTMYIYNENKSECEELPESICYRSEYYGVFFSVFDCSHTCSGGKGPIYCSAEPYKPAQNDTCTEKKRSWYDHDENSTEPNVAWYYNASLEECVLYKTCEDPWNLPKDANGHSKKYFCGKACEKFTAGTINGSADGSGTVNCTAEPTARCSAGNEKYGRTRYFYNASSKECEVYSACDGDWPKGQISFNYFVTNRSCALECGDYNASHYEFDVSARDDLPSEEDDYLDV
uniref:Putative secreted protein n=1 Tax=Amblyomma cajennense TaxID=34607 RepID=A0A023FEG6_AMBCJ